MFNRYEKLHAGETITFHFEVVISAEQDAIFDREEIKELIVGYLHKLLKHPYQFDDEDFE